MHRSDPPDRLPRSPSEECRGQTPLPVHKTETCEGGLAGYGRLRPSKNRGGGANHSKGIAEGRRWSLKRWSEPPPVVQIFHEFFESRWYPDMSRDAWRWAPERPNQG